MIVIGIITFAIRSPCGGGVSSSSSSSRTIVAVAIAIAVTR